MNVDCHNCGRVVADGLELCTLCADSLHRELLEIPGLVSDMTITRARLDRMSRGRVGGKSAETALPVRLDKFDQRPTQRPLDHLTLTLGTWAQAAADHTRQDQAFIEAWGSAGLRQLVHNHRDRKPDRAAISTEPAHAAELAAIWLADYVGDLRAVPDAGAMYDEITDAIAYARRAIDRQPELTYRGQCTIVVEGEDGAHGVCGADLYAEADSAYITCPWCAAQHEVRALMRTALGGSDGRLFTLTEMARVLKAAWELDNALDFGPPVPQSTLYHWSRNGLLRPRAWRQADGTDSEFWIRRSDPALYAISDVREVVSRRTARAE